MNTTAIPQTSFVEPTTYPFEVTQIIKEGHKAISFVLEPIEGKIICPVPGQYVLFSVEINNAVHRRYYSISSLVGVENSYRLTVQKVDSGLLSNWLFDNAFLGMNCQLSRPMGSFHLLPEDWEGDRNLAFFAAGSGITPLVPMLTLLTKENAKFHSQVFLSFKEPRDYIFQDELGKLQEAHSGLGIYVNYTQHEELGNAHSLERLTKSQVLNACPDIASRKVFICGSGEYVDDIKEMLASLGVSSDNMISELFSINHRMESMGDTVFDITFSDTGITVQASTDKSILELAEFNGVYIPSVCRSGLCGACSIRIKGETIGGCTDALDHKSICDGIRLACCTFPQGACEVSSDV